MRRLLPALPLALAVALVAGEARAQRLDLRYDAPRECPARPALLRQIADARSASARPDRALAAVVAVTPPGARWRAVITTRGDGGGGERTLEARSCARLVQAVALVIALAIDTEAERPDDAPPAAPSAPAAPSPVLFVDDGELPPVLRPRRRAPAAPAPSALRFGLAARVLVDAQTLPEPAPGFSLGLSLGGRFVRARLDATLLAARSVAGRRAGTRASFEAFAVSALGCARPLDAVELCAGVELTAMTARAEGFRQDGSDRSAYLATPVRLTLSLPLTRRFRVGVSPELVIPWTRTAYEVAGVGVVHAVPAVAFRGALGFEATWP